MQYVELKPQYDRQKSFYRKAMVQLHDDGTIKLISYTTNVVTIHPDKTISFYGWYSATTSRHIREFVRQYAMNKRVTKALIEECARCRFAPRIEDLPD